MQTLGLASDIQPTDGLLKRLFWPTIENQYDVDLVGQQGFWICAAVAVFSTAMLIFTGQVLIGILVGITYILAGIGVRERSVAAAVIIFLCYFLDRVSAFGMLFMGLGGGNPMLGIAATLLLFANVRATILSRKWRGPETPADISEMPERITATFGDKLANTMPAAVWPTGRFVFYPLGGLLLALTLFGMAMLPTIAHRRAAAAAAAQRDTFDVTLPAQSK